MVCLGFEPGAAGWKAWPNPLSYGGTTCAYYYSDYKHLVQMIIWMASPVKSWEVATADG